VSVSSLGLGGVELGPYPGEEPDFATASSVVTAGVESGVNWIDTSEAYLDRLNLGDGTQYVPDDSYERAQVLQWAFFEAVEQS
jgi:diketogulonate reductase-like aldo/keto reductase